LRSRIQVFVNTDKTKTEPWEAFVVYRVREMLRREQCFQDQFADATTSQPVLYEGYDNSPFDPIIPLFRNTESGDPVHDATYSKVWEQIMVHFESFLRMEAGHSNVKLFTLKPVKNKEGEVKVKYADDKKNERPYSAIRISLVHTPHSCRATFATNRQGLLSLSDTAELLGHANTVVTAHYTKPSIEQLSVRLRNSDESITNEFLNFDGDSEAIIRADKPDSALSNSFYKNRTGTVHKFKFMPSITLWSTTDLEKYQGEGLRLLQDGPMSRIIFRETHVCPVGEECPSDIVEKIGEAKRCGICPLAMKCIDHLTAIAAKCNQLVERIGYQTKHKDRLIARNEPTVVLDEIFDSIEIDTNELLGWKTSNEMLEKLRIDATCESDLYLMHVDEPEIVRKHLERVSRSSNTVEFLLQRIADSNAYPRLSSPYIEASASQIRKQILAGRSLDSIGVWSEDPDNIRATANMLNIIMKSKGLSIADMAKQLKFTIEARPGSLLA
jgi:hypothetical protein